MNPLTGPAKPYAMHTHWLPHHCPPSGQTESISLVTESTNQLKDRVQNVSEKLTTIADAMVEVHNSASESEEISAKINKLLV